MLQNEHFVAKFGADTAEHGPHYLPKLVLEQKLANVLGTVFSEFTFQHVAPQRKEKRKREEERMC